MSSGKTDSGKAAGRGALGPPRGAVRRGFRPQHPHPCRARRLGPHPRSRRCQGRGPLDALDAGCGTGFLSFELAAPRASGHRRRLRAGDARRGAAQGGGARRPVRFEEADAEHLPFPRRQLRPRDQPPRAVDVAAPGGGDRRMDQGAAARAGASSSSTGSSTLAFWSNQSQNARTSAEYAAIGDRLPFLGGRPREEIEALLTAHGLVGVGSDPVRRSGRGPGAADGRGGTRAADPPALRRLGRRAALSRRREAGRGITSDDRLLRQSARRAAKGRAR